MQGVILGHRLRKVGDWRVTLCPVLPLSCWCWSSGKMDILSRWNMYSRGWGHSNPLHFPNSSNLCTLTFLHLLIYFIYTLLLQGSRGKYYQPLLAGDKQRPEQMDVCSQKSQIEICNLGTTKAFPNCPVSVSSDWSPRCGVIRARPLGTCALLPSLPS